MVETRGGREFGATTSEGILFLGRTAVEGPCRVHYYLGPQATPLVEDGEIHKLGGIYYLADIDLKHQRVDILERDPEPGDDLVAMYFAGRDVQQAYVHLAQDDNVEGDVIAWPGRDLPAGAGIFMRQDGGLRFVGLVTGKVAIEAEGRTKKYLTIAGLDRLREALATPRVHPAAPEVKHRPDDISVIK